MHTHRSLLFVHALVLAFLVLGSGAIPAAALDTRTIWQNNCVRCHGPDGKGNTKMGRKLRIKDLTRPRVQARLTDDRILATIRDGLDDTEGKEEMPAFRNKLSESELKALMAHVRTLKTDERN
ncbi:MAG TPA: cytochrome c [Opitutaceae bacterium]